MLYVVIYTTERNNANLTNFFLSNQFMKAKLLISSMSSEIKKMDKIIQKHFSDVEYTN